MTTVLYPGSFDPFHLGHLQVIRAASGLFDRIVVAVVHNPQKSSFMFPLEERTSLVQASCAELPAVTVTSFSSLVVDLAAEVGADAILKGLRTGADFESELRMAQTNKSLTGIETILVPTEAEVGFISSTFVREITRLGGDATHMVPEPVQVRLRGMAPMGSGTA